MVLKQPPGVVHGVPYHFRHTACWATHCRFAELSTLIEPSKEPKTDKPTILVGVLIHHCLHYQMGNSPHGDQNRMS